jgi:hypothetical protein
MATEKTPAYRRIQRAEEGRDDWKVKAIERREDNEKLKEEVKEKLLKIKRLSLAIDNLNNSLKQSNNKILELEKEIASLKKKPQEKPIKHRYSVDLIRNALDLHGKAFIGYRTIAKVFEIMKDERPHFTTIKQWIIRYCVHQIQKPLEQSKDWIAIGDVTVDLGRMKCLAIVGIRKQALEEKKNFKLKHSDVEVLALEPTKKCNGEFVHGVLEEASKRVGGFFSINIDQGADVKKGAELYQEQHPETLVLFDIDHKLSLVMEHELEEDSVWGRYREMCSKTRNATKQTELAAISPPPKRLKARYMDIKDFVYFPERLLRSKKEGRLESISEERYKKYFSWIEEFEQPSFEWQYMYEVVGMIRSYNQEHGLSEGVLEDLEQFFKGAGIENIRLQGFTNKCLATVKKEVDKLVNKEEETLVSTVVIESIFGKYKEINSSYKGITGNILSILTFTGSPITNEGLKLAMEMTSVKKGMAWVEEKVGETLCSLKRQFFGKSSSQKLTA